MKFELDDSTLLRVSGVAAVALGASALAVPRDYHNRLYATVGAPCAPLDGGRLHRQPRRRSPLAARPLMPSHQRCCPVHSTAPKPASCPLSRVSSQHIAVSPFFPPPLQSSVFSEAPTRHSGVVASWLGAEQLVIAARDDLASRVRVIGRVGVRRWAGMGMADGCMHSVMCEAT